MGFSRLRWTSRCLSTYPPTDRFTIHQTGGRSAIVRIHISPPHKLPPLYLDWKPRRSCHFVSVSHRRFWPNYPPFTKINKSSESNSWTCLRLLSLTSSKAPYLDQRVWRPRPLVLILYQRLCSSTTTNPPIHQNQFAFASFNLLMALSTLIAGPTTLATPRWTSIVDVGLPIRQTSKTTSPVKHIRWARSSCCFSTSPKPSLLRLTALSLSTPSPRLEPSPSMLALLFTRRQKRRAR